jgi:Cytidylate kinase-like family
MDHSTKDDERTEEHPRDTPRHGFQGDRGAVSAPPTVPAGLTVAISREAGARGGSIGRRLGRKLAWAVYDQELLEYMAQEAAVRQNVVDVPSGGAAAWVEARMEQLLREQNLSQHPLILTLARVVLSLGVRGNVVLIGRGAGCILPRASTLYVRLISPLQERIAYMGEWLRLSQQEAAERVRLRDERRAAFLSTHFHRQPGDIQQYDLVLNSGTLGEDVCAELIARAARARAEAFPSPAPGPRTGERRD